MFNRRNFLLGSALLASTRQSYADIAVSAAPDFYAAFSSLDSIQEGSSGGTIHILYAPWCPVSVSLFNDTRQFLQSVHLNWIPHSGSQPEGRYATENLLRYHRPEYIPQFFTKLHQVMPMEYTPIADQQDSRLAQMMPLYYRDVGGNLATPTLFYMLPGERVRVVKGAPTAQQLSQIIQSLG